MKLRLVREEVLNGHVSIDRCNNDYGFSLLHRSQKGSLAQSIAGESRFRRRLWIGLCTPVRQHTLAQPFAGIACRSDGDTARIATKSRLPPPGLLAQGFEREVAEIEEEFFQRGAKR